MASAEWIANQQEGWDDTEEWKTVFVPPGALDMDGQLLTESVLQGRVVRVLEQEEVEGEK